MTQQANRESLRSSYDYVIVGAGAAGCVLASELSTSGAQVLLIESGGTDDAPTVLNPSVWFYNVGGPLDYSLPRMSCRSTKPRKTGREAQMRGAAPVVRCTCVAPSILIRPHQPLSRRRAKWGCPSLKT